MKPTVAVVFGTRPEAIKLCPVVHALCQQSELDTRVWVTAQHREMLDQVLATFDVVPDIDLNVMIPNQTLAGLTARLTTTLDATLNRDKPDALIVQGDTTTTFVASLVAFYHRIPVGHVEAGLRTQTRSNPFPEEINRRLASRLCEWHFAPTEWAASNLHADAIPSASVWVVGNTVIDALLRIKDPTYCFEDPLLAGIDFKGERVILVTSHRRESFGERMQEAFRTIRELVDRYADVRVLFPVHPNPNVRATTQVLQDHPRIHLLEPQTYEPFVQLMARSHFILTDSGGIQEEAPSLGKPVLVMRETTERPEAVDAGTAVLVGTSRDRILAESSRLLEDADEYARRSQIANPYGDGRSATRIAEIMARELSKDQ